MTKEVIVPKLGLTMEEAYIVSILVKEGDEVKVDDDLFEVETDKVTSNIKSEVNGIVTKILAEEEETYPLGAVLAHIDEK